MFGQRVRPEAYHQLTLALSDQDLSRLIENIRGTIKSAVDRMPTHQDFLDRYCKASGAIWSTPGPM